MSNKSGSALDPVQVKATQMFIEQIGTEKAAGFIINLQRAIDGLTQNNEQFVQAYRDIIEAPKWERVAKLLADTLHFGDQFDLRGKGPADTVKRALKAVEDA